MLEVMVAGQGTENHDMYCSAVSQFDYYPEYVFSQEMCAAGHPQLCAVHGEYGPATVPMVSTNSSPPIALPVQVPPGHMVQQIVDESGTLHHVILSPQPPMVPLPGHYGPGPATSTSQPPQPFYTHQGLPPGYPPPPHYGTPLQPGVLGHVAPQQGHSPPPHNFHKDERTHRQYIKLKKKFEHKQHLRGEGSSNASQGTPPLSPRKEVTNGMRRSKERNAGAAGTSEDGEESSSVQDEEEEEVRLLTEFLSNLKPPEISELNTRSALLQWSPPDKPLSETADSRSAEFDVPESDYQYEVLLSDKGKDGKYKSIYTGSSQSCRLQDLHPATEYSVRFQVHLQDIQGSPSEPTTFTTPPCEPDTPQPPKLVQRTRTSLQLRWNATAENGSHITHYILEYVEGKGTEFVEVYKNRGKQYNITKLQASTCYRFRLSAVNEYGRSNYSDEVHYSTSGSPPAQPSPPVLLEASVNRLQLTWQQRPNDDDFSLQMEDLHSGHGFLPIYNGHDTHYVCDRLRRHTEYKFRLRANNEEGPSRWSDEVCYRTLPDRPAAPSKPSLKGRVHAHMFKVRWDPPGDRGGAEITSYILEINAGKGYEIIYTGSETECICDRLSPGTTYQIRVSCRSMGGHSDYSEPCAITTEPVCPGQCSPPRLHAKPRATSLSLKWSYPDYDGGSPINEFEVDMTNSDSTKRQAYKGKETECVVTDLSPGRPYLFQVKAYNRVGGGPWSDPLEVVSGAGPPDMPRELQATCKSPHSVLVQWDDPLNNGASILEYIVEMSVGSEEEFSSVFQGLANSHEIKGLTAATLYCFRVQAVNSAGASPFSPVVQMATPASPPGIVSQLRYTATPSSLTLLWQEPNAHGAEILQYNIDVGEQTVTSIGSSLEYTIEGLQPETTYRIRIQAVNSMGSGPYSAILKATTSPLPPAPPRLECLNVGHNYLKLKWGDAKNANLLHYTVQMENARTKEFQSIYQGSSHTCKVSKLMESTAYRFRIFAANDAGDGPYSDVFEFVTAIAPPPALKAPRLSDVTHSSCVVEWTPCRPYCTDPISYQLQRARVRDQDFRQVYKGLETKIVLNDLEPGAEYCVRVCPVRQTSTGNLPGAYSPAAMFSTPSPDPVNNPSNKPVASQALETKPLSDQQWAIIILSGFTMVAVLAAVIMQQLISWSKSSS